MDNVWAYHTKKYRITLAPEGHWSHSVPLILALTYLASVTLDAPIRYALSLVKLAPLLYLRDFVGPLLFIIVLIRGIFWRRWKATPLWIAAILAFHCIIGALSIGSIPQVLFGLKVWLPLLAGTIAGSFLDSKRYRNIFLAGCLAIWIISIIGVSLQVAGVSFPWKGFTSEVGGVEIEGQRSWSTGGLQRVSGFGRVSTDTAANLISQGALAGIILSPIPRIILGIITLIAVAATTMKAMIMTSLLFLALVTFNIIRVPGRKWIMLTIHFTILLGVILLPILALVGWIEITISNPIQYLLLASVQDRILNTWPAAVQLIMEAPFPWLGRGIGGIGSAQVYFEKASMNPADNLFVFMAVTFGAFVVPYFFLLVRSTNQRVGENLQYWKGRTTLMACLSFIGLTTGTIECAGALFLVGIAISAMGVDSHVDKAKDC